MPFVKHKRRRLVRLHEKRRQQRITIIVFPRQFRFLFTDWSFVPKIFPFSEIFRGGLRRPAIGLIRKRDASPRDGQHPLRGDRLLRRIRLPQRRDAPKTISSSRGNSSILATSCLGPRSRHVPRPIPTCLRTTASFCLRIFDRRDSMNRYRTDTRTLRNRPRVGAPLSPKVLFFAYGVVLANEFNSFSAVFHVTSPLPFFNRK